MSGADEFDLAVRSIRDASNVSDREVQLLLGELRYLTDWHQDVLCRELGCSGGEASSERVAHSINYLNWVRDLCATVDPSRERVNDRREVVVRAFALCDGAGGPVSGRVDRCREAMRQPVGGGYSGNSLLLLGEIAEAWRQAARALPDGQAHEAQARLDRHSPRLRTSHLHRRRLLLLYSGSETDIGRGLGETVAARMRSHVAGCSRCQMVVTQELGLSWREAELRPNRAKRAA